MALQEDLSAFFSPEGFAERAVLAGVVLHGIFSAPSALGNVGTLGMGVDSPSFVLPSALVPPDPVGLALQVSAGSYVVAQETRDGTGISTLLLESAP